MSEQSLAHLTVLIPRPEPKAYDLANALSALGATAWPAPVIAIRPVDPVRDNSSACQPVSAFDWLIFTSRYAVQHCPSWLKSASRAYVKQAAVGLTTARYLEKATHQKPDLLAEGSEALLQSNMLHYVSNRRIGIVAGLGGRDLLEKTLKQRGAQVEKLACYERCYQSLPTLFHEKASALAPDAVNWIVATSVACLDALKQTLNDNNWAILKHKPLLAFSARIANEARGLGYEGEAVITSQMTDQGLIQTLIQHSDSQCL